MRRAFKTIFWRLGWTALALAFIPFIAYIALLALNWRDRAPSPAAIRLNEASLTRSAVADADNAYVFMMGFAVPPNEDPRRAGAVRTAWAADFTAGATTTGDPIRPTFDITASRSSAVRELAEICEVANEFCASALANDATTLTGWLSDEQWLLSRYESLLAYAAWQEPVPFDLRIPFPSYSTVIEAQRLFHVRAWNLAHTGNSEALRNLLASDIRFWRLTLRSADLLITKTIAVAALRHHFELANLVLRELPAGMVRNAVPEEWFVEISSAERSLLRCLAGEWKYVDGLVRQTKRSESGALAVGEDASLTQRLLWRAMIPLLQPQDSSNDAADRFVMLATELDVPYAEFATALSRVRANVRHDTASSGPTAYNALGTLLGYDAPADYTAYAVRVADLEGIRRAALLTATLRADGVSAAQVARQIAGSDIRDPYSSKPFEWDERAHAVVFTGLEDTDRRRHALVY